MRKFTEFVKEHFKDTEQLIGVEVGIWQGDNALDIVENLKPKMLVLVDCWNESVEKIAGFCQDSQRSNFISTYDKFANTTNVIIIKGVSVDVAKLFCQCFDFVYLDANHGETVDDIGAWYPLVKSNGIIGGHDYNMDGVYLPVQATFSKFGYDKETSQGVDWWVVK